jgi:hypothetical protein
VLAESSPTLTPKYRCVVYCYCDGLARADRERLALRLGARRARAAADFILEFRPVAVGLCRAVTLGCASGEPSLRAWRRARFQSLCATDEYLRARLASRFASFSRLRARRNSSLASRTRCRATSACSLARSIISTEPSFSGGESSAGGISLPVFFMTCLQSELPVSHKPGMLATAPCGGAGTGSVEAVIHRICA